MQELGIIPGLGWKDNLMKRVGLERKDLEEGKLSRQDKKKKKKKNLKQKWSWFVLETRWAVQFCLKLRAKVLWLD